MKLLLSWLNDYVDLKGIKPQELADKLVHIGFEVEDIITADNECILDISITANRPDCQSVYGMAREIGAVLKRKVKPLKLSYKTAAASCAPVAVDIEDYALCSRYTGRIIKNVRIKESPDIIKKRLTLLGLKPINNIVDITNYVLLEVGQPLHAFDIRYIEEKIIVRNASKGERLKLLDGSEYNLTEKMLVIADKAKPLALAGVMGGEYSGIANDTQTVFLESARFARGSIRATARSLGIKSDSSARFEKGVDYESIDIGRERALALMDELDAGTITDLVCETSAPQPPQKVVTTSALQIVGVLGISIPEKKIVDILTALGFTCVVKNKKIYCTVPLFREDIDGYADLAEEVIRFYGYDKLTSTMFNAGETVVGGYSVRDNNIRAVKELMLGFGAFEIVTYSFIPQKQYDSLSVPASDKLRETIKIINPLSEDYAAMRTQLSGNMLNTVRLNRSRKNDNFRLFEVSRRYIADKLPLKALPQENETLCMAFVGKGEDYYTLKSAVTELLVQFKIEHSLAYTDCAWLHPGMGAKIITSTGVIGHFGKIHPIAAKNFELSEDVFLAEICLESLISRTMPNITYQILPKYPAVDRDLAVVVKDEFTVGELSACIQAAAEGLCKQVELFDIYKGAQIEQGFKSIAFSIRLQSAQSTLADAQIQDVMKNICNALQTQFGAKLR